MNIIDGVWRMLKYYNPTDEENKDLKRQLIAVINSEQKYSPEYCLMGDCEEPPTLSHEISKGLFLKEISNDNKVCTFNRDFNNNIRQFKLKEENIRKASAFRGFCDEHDTKLFRSFENNNFELNNDFIHKQSLRTVGKEIFLLQRELKVLKEFRAQNKYNLKLLNNFIRGQEKNLNKYLKVFKKIENYITKESSCLSFNTINCEPNEIAFSKMQYIRPYFIFNTYIFIHIFHRKGKTICTLATFNDFISKSTLKLITKEQEPFYFNLNKYILNNRQRLYTSNKFYSSLSAGEKQLLIDDSRVIPNLLPLSFVTKIDRQLS